MNTLLWAGLAANALIHLRAEVLRIQDDVDRAKAGAESDHTKAEWGGLDWFCLALAAVFSPIITVYKIAKFVLFPRGITSKFAKEQEAKAAAAAELETVRQQVEIVRTWAPGQVVLAEPQPQQAALGWDAAADAFDEACKHVADTAGQPWSPAPKRKRIQAKVAKVADQLDPCCWDGDCRCFACVVANAS